MKNIIFFDVMPSVLIEVYRRFREQRFVAVCFLLLLGLLFYSEDRGSKFLRNVSERLCSTWHHIPEDSTFHNHAVRTSNPALISFPEKETPFFLRIFT
jgi:hypothetical protein